MSVALRISIGFVRHACRLTKKTVRQALAWDMTSSKIKKYVSVDKDLLVAGNAFLNCMNVVCFLGRYLLHLLI